MLFSDFFPKIVQFIR